MDIPKQRPDSPSKIITALVSTVILVLAFAGFIALSAVDWEYGPAISTIGGAVMGSGIMIWIILRHEPFM